MFINAKLQSHTGNTPCKIVYGYNLQLLIDITVLSVKTLVVDDFFVIIISTMEKKSTRSLLKKQNPTRSKLLK